MIFFRIVVLVFLSSFFNAHSHTLVNVASLSIANLTIGSPLSTHYTKAFCYVQREVADALARVALSLAQKGYGIHLVAGYQPKEEQQKIWDALMHQKSNDDLACDAHTCGMAVDVTLFDLAYGTAEMHIPCDCITQKILCDCSEVSPKMYMQRELLKSVMLHHGFVQKSNDPWWHFELPLWQDVPMPNVSLEALALAAQ